jgi:hypothetical protein
MKTASLMLALATAAFIALGTVAPTPVFADRGGHKFRSHADHVHVKPHFGHKHFVGHFHHRPRVSVGFVFGPGFWGYYPPYPYYYPSYYYYPPTVVAVPSAPPTYIERGAPEEAPGPAAYWYFCRDANAYYPYVKQCPGGWERVTPSPPPER